MSIAFALKPSHEELELPSRESEQKEAPPPAVYLGDCDGGELGKRTYTETAGTGPVLVSPLLPPPLHIARCCAAPETTSASGSGSTGREHKRSTAAGAGCKRAPRGLQVACSLTTLSASITRNQHCKSVTVSKRIQPEPHIVNKQ